MAFLLQIRDRSSKSRQWTSSKYPLLKVLCKDSLAVTQMSFVFLKMYLVLRFQKRLKKSLDWCIHSQISTLIRWIFMGNYWISGCVAYLEQLRWIRHGYSPRGACSLPGEPNKWRSKVEGEACTGSVLGEAHPCDLCRRDVLVASCTLMGFSMSGHTSRSLPCLLGRRSNSVCSGHNQVFFGRILRTPS